MNYLNRYKRLSLWNKIAVLGAIASIAMFFVWGLSKVVELAGRSEAVDGGEVESDATSLALTEDLNDLNLVRGDFQNWTTNRGNCTNGSVIRERAMMKAVSLKALNDGHLRSDRPTKVMAKYQGVAAAHSIAAGVSLACADSFSQGLQDAVASAKSARANVAAALEEGRRILRAAQSGDDTATSLKKTVEPLERMCRWMDNRAVCILYWCNQVNHEEALRAAETARALFPNEEDPPIDRLLAGQKRTKGRRTP